MAVTPGTIGRRTTVSGTARASRRPLARALAHHRVALAMVALVALGGGLRAAQAAHPGRYLSADERSYARIAHSLGTGGNYAADGLTDPWHWAPGTPALFAVAHGLAPGADGDGSPQQLRTAFWAQALFGTLLIVAVFLLAGGIAGPVAGLLAAGAIATYPPLITATGDLVSEPLGGLTLTLAAIALLDAWRRPHWRTTLVAGAAIGLAMLVRADLLVLPLVLAGAWLVLARKRIPAPRRARLALALALVPMLIVGPWIAYASSHAGRLVPIASSGPSTLFVGTYLPGGGKLSGVRRSLRLYVRRQMPNLHRTPIVNVPGEFVLRAYIRERHPEIVPGPYQAIPSGDLRRALSFEARRNLRTFAIGHPVAYAAMELRKVTRMWGGYYRGGTRNPRAWISAWHLLLVGLAISGVLAGLALGRRRAQLALVLVPVALGTAINVVFVAQARHNLRLLPLLVSAGAAGAMLAVHAVRARAQGLPIEADPPGDQITAERTALQPQITLRRTRRREPASTSPAER